MEIDLLEEIWCLIFRYLDKKSLQNTQLVCKKWLDIILNDVVLTGEYHLKTRDLTSSEINNILLKRKKLKIFRCYDYHISNLSDDEVRDLEEIGILSDLRFVDFKVCKDLKKVVVGNHFQTPQPRPKLPKG